MDQKILDLLQQQDKKIEELKKQKDQQIQELKSELYNLNVRVQANKEVFTLFKKNIEKLENNSSRNFKLLLFIVISNVFIFFMVFVILGSA